MVSVFMSSHYVLKCRFVRRSTSWQIYWLTLYKKQQVCVCARARMHVCVCVCVSFWGHTPVYSHIVGTAFPYGDKTQVFYL